MSGWTVRPRKPQGFTEQAVNPERSLPEPLRIAARRAKKMSNRDLFDWADTSLSEIGKLLVQHSHDDGAGDHLRDAVHSAAALYACLAESAARLPVPPPGVPAAETLRRMGSTMPG